MWSALYTGLAALVTADTGSGGLFETSGANKVVGTYQTQAPQGTSLPYIVITRVSDNTISTFANDKARTVVVQFDVWTAMDAGTADGDDIIERARTVFSRVAPTVSGFTCSAGRVVSQRGPDIQDEGVRHAMDVEYTLTKD